MMKMENLKSLFFQANQVGFLKLDQILHHFNIYDVRSPCPIHGGDNPTAFFLNKETGTWKCFTNRCHYDFGGDMVGLVAGLMSINKVEAARWIINTFSDGIEMISEDDIERAIFIKGKTKKEKRSNKIFNKELLSTLKNKSIYGESRGLSYNVLAKFNAFECLDRNKPLYNRLCFPIFDPSDQLIGFTGRDITDKQEPKWLHLPCNILISETFFGLNHARDEIKKKKTAIITEGPFDVLRIAEAGIDNVIGLLGTEISQKQIKILLNLGVRNIVFALDPDPAGQDATNYLSTKCSLYFNCKDISSKFTKDPGETEIERIKEIFNEN